MRFEGPSDDDIEKVIDEIARRIEGGAPRFIKSCVVGAQGLLKRAYNAAVYEKPSSYFGYPRDKNQTLAQAVIAETSGLHGSVYTTKREASFVEFGTGFYATRGARGRITPRAKKLLAYPVWRLPQGFKGRFVPREKTKGRNVPYDAIGLVLSKSVRGMRPRPVWTSPPVLKAVEKIIEVEAKNAGF